MSEEIKRMKYETGLFMTEEEFKVEQEYHMRMRRLHNRHLHTAGIVWGLDLVPDVGTYRVDIHPGMALDVYADLADSEEISREILVAQKTTLDLSSSGYSPGDEIYIWLHYREEEADVSANAGGQSIHYLESFSVGHLTEKPDNEALNVILGKVILNSEGKISSVVTEENGESLRLYAGFKGKTLETDRLILSDDAISESNPYLDGKLFLPDGTPGIEVHSPRTHFSGELKVDGDIHAKKSTVILNAEEQGSGVSDRYAGLKILRGLLETVRLVYDEEDDRWKGGREGVEETLALLNEVYTRTQLDDFFSGESASGKKQVDWANVLNKIDAYTKADIDDFFSGQSVTGKKQVDWSNVIHRPASTNVGNIGLYVEPSAPTGVLYLNGATISRSTFPELWSWVSAHSASILNDSNQAAWGSGDGNTTFRLPDWRGLFLRMAGYNSTFKQHNGSKYNGGALLQVLLDQIENITANWNSAVSSGSWNSNGAVYGIGNGSAEWNAWGHNGTRAYFNAGRVVRAGAETRPVSVAVNYGVTYE